MQILKPFLNPKKLRKLQNNPKAFFKDAIDKRIFPISNQLKTLKPKKKNAFGQYYIISAVYNVEKYLDDYFDSILKQRLDFKNNIHIICVDDGSTDNSAQIIKKYQSKYPNNITYLCKENGGQASARNLGLKWLKERLGESYNNTIGNGKDNIWVTFTDPDDFLDRDYFYEVDRFLETHQRDDISMVGCKIVEYFEQHCHREQALCIRDMFNVGIKIFNIAKIPSNAYLSFANCSFFKLDHIKHSQFDESLKPHFEDGKFICEFLFCQQNTNKICFLPKSTYYYRKRKTDNSTLSTALAKDSTFLVVPKVGWLSVLSQASKKYEKVPHWLQNTLLWELFWSIERLIEKPQNARILSPKQQEEYLDLLNECFKYIDNDMIISRDFLPYTLKMGFLHCFKQAKLPYRILHFGHYDKVFKEFVFSYFTDDKGEKYQFLFDDKEAQISYEETKEIKLLSKVFLYEKIFYIKVPQEGHKFEVFLGGKRANIEYKNLYYRQFFYVQKFLKDSKNAG